MEWLKDVLGEELYTTVKNKLDEKQIRIANLNEGKFIPKDKFNAKNDEAKNLKEQLELLAEKSKKVDSLVNSNEELKKQINSINDDFNSQLEAKNEEIINMSKKSILNKVFSENKVVYPELLMNSIDINNIELDGENLKNFNIDDYKTKYPNMFEVQKQQGQTNPQQGFGQNPSSKKAQLIEQYNKAAENRNVREMSIIQNKIRNLKED
jgi:hypothetical protein